MSTSSVVVVFFLAPLLIAIALLRHAFRCPSCGGWKSGVRITEVESPGEFVGDTLGMAPTSQQEIRERVCSHCEHVISSVTDL